MSDNAPVSAAEAVRLIAELAGKVAQDPELDEVLQHALELAVDIVPGCEQAGISLLRNGIVSTPASYGPLARLCDKLQEQLGEGPCVTSLRDAEILQIDDLSSDTRWPAFAKEASNLGVRSILSCRLATPHDRLAALNMYATVPNAFTEHSQDLALGYATHVGLALSALDKENNLRRALRTREVIGQAMGILMERHRILASQAFDLMVHISQCTNVKLRDIAEELVQTGTLPET